MSHFSRGFLSMFLLAIAASACTFVDLKPRGEKVRILAQQEVGRCKPLGKVTVATAAKVAFIARPRDNVREELLRLARNHAGAMDGDTIVAEGEVVDGEQRFGVYRCIIP